MSVFFYISLIIVVLFVALQVYMRLQSQLKRGKQVKGLPENFVRELDQYPEVLIYFYTPSCSACKVMTPVIDRLKNEFKNIIKVNLSRDTSIGRLFGILGTPTIVLVQGTVIQNFVVGARKEDFIRKLLTKNKNS
ncbi:thioredoxin [candidate division KSB1 bacterium]|nr:MAG: thioredoxin [candidate division KSB1 bacterium]